MSTETLTYTEATRLLNYNPDTGLITWKINRGGHAKKGTEAGTLNWDNHRHLRVNYKIYQAHRIAWLLVHGHFPLNEIDHINGIHNDNRLINLRDVTGQENACNRPVPKNNTSGVMGVSWCKKINKWHARIRKNYQYILLGDYTNWFDAVCARKAAEHQYGFHINHGRR